MENKELETWLSETKAKNLSRKELFDYANNNDTLSINLFYKLRDSLNANDLIQTVDKLFNQWQKETEFSPKRGDRVLVWDIDERKVFERIFLADIKGSSYPIIVVGIEHENEFVNNEPFATTVFKHMKPLPTELPTETDFKSQVIELIEKRIIIAENNLSSVLEDKLYNDAAMWENDIRTLQKLLNKIKNLC